MIKDGLWDAYNNYHMGTTAENIADIWGITRHDDLSAGAADHARGVSGDGMGDAGLDGGLAGHVLALGGGQDAAKHDLIHLLGLHAGTVQSLFDDDGTQIDGRGVLQRAAKGTNRGSAAIHNIKISHSINPSN